MNATKNSPKNAAHDFAAACSRNGWNILIKGEQTVAICKQFAANDRDAFVSCDGDYYDLLTILPARGGSMWGTDGGSVGGYVAMTSGTFVMNQSGISKVAVRELDKIVA
jgi:hypothetical protein